MKEKIEVNDYVEKAISLYLLSFTSVYNRITGNIYAARRQNGGYMLITDKNELLRYRTEYRLWQGIPSVEVTNFMTMSFYLFDAILAAVVVIFLPFVDVEKKLPEINAELLRRKKEAVLARGEEWIEPEELERMEQEKAAIIREENRIADLKAKCAKKGLDFDTENAKYLAKQAKKAAKKK